MSGGYDGAALALHWITAVLIVANLALGLSMVPLPLSPQKLRWYGWHKWVGITIFLLTWARLAWRWGHPAPAPVAMPGWQRRAAAVSHSLLYVLMLVVPVSGWLYSSATGVQVVYLGLVPLPDAVPKDKVLAAVLKNVHVVLNAAMFALIAVHVAAAFKHHFVDGDEVLARMWPWTKRKGLSMRGIARCAMGVGLALVVAAATGPALAQGVVTEKSDIRFVANQLGVKVEGRFRRFKANVVFRPSALQASRAEIDVDLSSVDLASEDSEREVKGAMWFDSNRFPVAKFTSTSFRDLGGGKFQVVGNLSLKGVTRELTIPFALGRDAAGNRIVESTFGVKRLEFKVGQGEWGDPNTVADNVVVRVRLVLTPEG